MTIRCAIVGLGYWGPNLARNVAASLDFELVALVEPEAGRLQAAGRRYPAARQHAALEEALEPGDVDLVCVATPVRTHAALATKALEAGCHVLVEKPLALSLAEAASLLRLAEQVSRHVFVDHTFLFTGAVRELKRRMSEGQLGELHYVDSVRINLGLFQSDVDVIWDLAPHDLSILQHLLGEEARSVQALGTSRNPKGLVDVAYLHVTYASGLTAHLHLSWLSPVKVRRMILAGSERCAIWDDLEPAEKVKLYEHGVDFDVQDVEERREVLVNYRRGDVVAPRLSTDEALTVEFAHLAEVIQGGAAPVAPGADGAAVVATLEAATRSLATDGARVQVEPLAALGVGPLAGGGAP